MPNCWCSGTRTPCCAARSAGSDTSPATGCGLQRCRAWFPAADRHHRQPGRRVDHAGSPQHADGPGPARARGQVRDQGQAGPVHQFFRRRVHRRGHQDPGQPAAGTSSERDLRTGDRHPATGTPRPAADRQRAAPAPGADRLLDVPQNGPGRIAPLASSPQLKQRPAHPSPSISPSTVSTGNRSSADSPTSTTSLRNCSRDTPNRISEPTP